MEEYFDNQHDIEVIGIAYDGKECLNMLEELEPDVLILDIIMQHVDGLAVLNMIRTSQRDHHPNVIMLTAFGQEEVMKKAVDLGASYFVLKPFALDHLADRVYKEQEYEPKFANTHMCRQRKRKRRTWKQALRILFMKSVFQRILKVICT